MFNCALEEMSVRAKAERDSDGKITKFYLDTDISYILYSQGEIQGPMEVLYENEDDPTEVTGLKVPWTFHEGEYAGQLVYPHWHTVDSWPDCCWDTSYYWDEENYGRCTTNDHYTFDPIRVYYMENYEEQVYETYNYRFDL